MKDYQTGQLRNVVLLSHQGAGKTSLAESMLLASGALSRAGRVEDGNTVADFDPEEIDRGLSLAAAVVPVEWAGGQLPGGQRFAVAQHQVVMARPVSGVHVNDKGD